MTSFLEPEANSCDGGGPPCRSGCGSARAERDAFLSRCGPKIARWSRLQGLARHVRGLAIDVQPNKKVGVFTNLWGAGHTLPALYQLHALCLDLERYCYVRLYDTDYDAYFGYFPSPNRSTWSIPPRARPGRSAGPWASLRDHAGDAEFRRYAGYNSSQLHTPHVELTCDRHNHEGFIESVLRPALAPHNATALLRVRIGGYLPRPAEMLRRHDAEAAALPDACLSRYVTEPRFPARPRLADTPAATTAVHLRTGFADAEDAMAAGVRASAAGTARWVRAACGDDPFGDGAPRLVVTDAPGIARHFAARYPTAVVGASALPPNQTTRSWWATLEMKFATLDDIVAAGRARTLRVAPQRMVGRRAKIEGKGKGLGRAQFSGFYRPIAARSMCLTSVEFSAPECPRWAGVFVRDLPSYLNVLGLPHKRDVVAGRLNASALRVRPGAERRFDDYVRAQVAPQCPCRNASVVGCYVDWAGALK